MLIKFYKIQYFWVIICALCLAFASLFLTAMSGREGNGDSGLTLFYREEGLCATLFISDSLSSVARAGEPAALLLTLTVAKGYAIEEVTVQGEISAWTVTCREEGTQGQKTLTLLLDGYVCKDMPDGNRLLTLRLAPTDVDSRRDGEALISLQSSCLYYVKDGDVYTCPLTVEPENGLEDITSESIQPPEDDTRNPKEDDTASETRLETEGGEEIPAVTVGIWETVDVAENEPEDPGTGRLLYVGCQETRPERGVFEVRFLFCGEVEDASATVICMRGGGLLSLSGSRAPLIEESVGGQLRSHSPPAGREWHILTFGGLKATDNYEFLVYTEGKLIRVRYEGGCFAGVTEMR